MKTKYNTKQLERFISGYNHPDHGGMLVLTRVEHGKRSYWLHNPSESVPDDAEIVGTVADVRVYYGL